MIKSPDDLPEASDAVINRAYDRMQKAGTEVSEEPCYFCGRPLSQEKMDSAKVWVHRTVNGYLLADGEEVPEGDESQGMFPTGSSCIKKIPAKYRHKL